MIHLPLNHFAAVLGITYQGLKCVEQLGKTYRTFWPPTPENSAMDAKQLLADKQPKAPLDRGEFTK
ncbi:hypothetical protein GKA01_26830 [Gluconobacter kanchanaburiensis NBRC 103587]|uniref:Uncharacterized protein n=1 Tax=Gluconobacter kanchanaburiensis NBRC 103587 TaxID=1307948 RepID=A0A511BAN9_9PROT|nr:hypothetical protein AA103587_1090 [Gluconobacter kanchanaburiensis NBRC 103587]GEK97486.1 hypothetical protein GKA01_26830 [Gluconobacter kanchanaburiensis NBRC 103587]